LDTSRVFQKEQDEYRRCLIKSYLTDEETAEQEARQYYDKMKSGRRAGRVYVKHIFKYLPQNISGHTLREMESRMDSIYRALAKEGGAVPSFDACVLTIFNGSSEIMFGQRIRTETTSTSRKTTITTVLTLHATMCWENFSVEL
jgi:hypothetical protein